MSPDETFVAVAPFNIGATIELPPTPKLRLPANLTWAKAMSTIILLPIAESSNSNSYGKINHQNNYFSTINLPVIIEFRSAYPYPYAAHSFY